MYKRQIQTTGLAFGGTSLCSYHVRDVDGSCAKHLTVESYIMVIYAANSLILIIISFPSSTDSCISGLKPYFSANPSHHSLSVSSPGLTTWILQTFTVTSEHIHFLLFSFPVLHFLVVRLS